MRSWRASHVFVIESLIQDTSAGSLIEDRTKPVLHRFHFLELIYPGFEERQFPVAQLREGIAE